LVLGIDLGTSYFKAGLFDRSGRLRGLGRAEVLKDVTADGRCELPVERFWKLVRECIGAALGQAQVGPEDIAATCYSSQANSVVLLDGDSIPLTPLVLWPDLRAGDLLPELHRLTQRADFLDVTGLGVVTPEFCIAKLLWYQQRLPDLWSRVSCVRTMSDYLVAELTGLPSGDEGTASLLGLWDLRSHDWWDDALQAVALSRAHMSRPLAPGTVAGNLSEGGAKRAGLAPQILLAVGSLDHHVAAMGAGIRDLRHVCISIGTVVACLCYRDAYHPLAHCCMGRGTHGHEYYQIAFDGNGAGALDWYAREHAAHTSVEDMTSMARNVPPGSEGLFALPSPQRYRLLEGFLDASERHTNGHHARAMMESTAASARSLLGLLCTDAQLEGLIATGGGARNELWLQILADVTGLVVSAPDGEEPACLGAAMMAAVAAGWFDDLFGATSEWCRVAREYPPDPCSHVHYLDWYQEYMQRISRMGPEWGRLGP
jgi:sugar (pentulose or hexulose) kinase